MSGASRLTAPACTGPSGTAAALLGANFGWSRAISPRYDAMRRPYSRHTLYMWRINATSSFLSASSVPGDEDQASDLSLRNNNYRLQTPESKSTGAVTSSAEVMCTEPVPAGYVR